MAKKEVKLETREPRFPKEQIVLSETYVKHRDLVNALLSDGEEYSLKEVDSMIEKYRKGKVK